MIIAAVNFRKSLDVGIDDALILGWDVWNRTGIDDDGHRENGFGS